MDKKIAIIIERANIVLGGAERSVFELSTALTALGFKTNIIAAKGQTNTKNIRILCKDLGGKRTSYAVFAETLKKYLAENHYDIIHSVLPFDFADIYQPRGGSFAESILRNTASYQNKFVESYKSMTAFANFRRSALLRAERKLCKNEAGPLVVAISKYVAEQFKKHYNLSSQRIKVIPNGVKTNKPINTAEADRLRAQILAQLNIKEADNPVLFLFVANNFRLKGLTCLIKAMALSDAETSQRPGFLVVAGSGKAHKYRALAKKLHIPGKVIFLGTVRHIQNAFSITDVAVLPTFYDPASRFILEAIAAQKPVITTEFNGAKDLFVAGQHGKVIDAPENIGELAKALNYFKDTDNIQKASQAIAADNLIEKVSITHVAEQLATLYEKILKERIPR